MFTEGFLLGLSVGPGCLASCTVVVSPYLLGEGASVSATAVALSKFLGGRLLGYLLFGGLAWKLGRVLVPTGGCLAVATGALQLILAVLLLVYGLDKRHPSHSCSACEADRSEPVAAACQTSLPVALGLASGLSVCRPFVLVATTVVTLPSLAQSLAFFGAFFVGTSIFLLPLLSIGCLRQDPGLRAIGRAAAVAMGALYGYRGLTTVIHAIGSV